MTINKIIYGLVIMLVIHINIMDKTQAADSYNIIINIESSSLAPNKDPNFEENLAKINHWINKYFFEQNRSIGEYKNVLSSLKTHAFLYRYAESLVNIEEAHLNNALINMEKIWDKRGELKIPQTEEAIFGLKDEVKNMENFINFQKINRHLFDEYDRALDHIFKKHQEDSIEFAYPTIEWASNVMLFDFISSHYNDESFTLTPKHLKKHIKTNFKTEDLVKYLVEGWETLVKAFHTLTILEGQPQKYKEEEKKIIEALMCTQCYPARKDILMSGQKSMLESPKRPEENKISLEKMLNNSELNYVASDYYYARCSKILKQNITRENESKYHTQCEQLEKEDKEHKKNFCKNYFPKLIDYYVQHYMSKFTLDEKVTSLLKKNDYERVTGAFRSLFMTMDENPCNVLS